MLLLSLLLLGGCPVAAPDASVDAVDAPGVRTGAQRLVDGAFEQVAGWTVGLVINHTAVVDTSDGGPPHLVDRIHDAPNVNLGAIFGPEHSYRGISEAGVAVAGGRDETTGAPVFSLYGRRWKPTQAQLVHLDALVFDMQDVGARFYTYITTMGLAMQAAAEARIPFVVLDRPNPIGDGVEGFLLEPAHSSFIGRFRITQTHGLTVGELARMIKGEKLLPGLEALDLRIVEMEGYDREMLWMDTGLPWIPPSPNIPDATTTLSYPGVALFENSAVNEGRGTRTPFLAVGAPWADEDVLERELNDRGLPGVTFEGARYTPVAILGKATSPTHRGRLVHGVRVRITDPRTYRPVATGVHLLHAFYHTSPPEERGRFFNRTWLAKLAGTTRLQEMLEAGASPAEIIDAWESDVEAFRRQRHPYLLYR